FSVSDGDQGFFSRLAFALRSCHNGRYSELGAPVETNGEPAGVSKKLPSPNCSHSGVTTRDEGNSFDAYRSWRVPSCVLVARSPSLSIAAISSADIWISSFWSASICRGKAPSGVLRTSLRVTWAQYWSVLFSSIRYRSSRRFPENTARPSRRPTNALS